MITTEPATIIDKTHYQVIVIQIPEINAKDTIFLNLRHFSINYAALIMLSISFDHFKMWVVHPIVRFLLRG